MNQSDCVSEFLHLHRRFKAGQLTAIEAERWRNLKETLTQAADSADQAAPQPDPLEWDPDLEQCTG